MVRVQEPGTSTQETKTSTAFTRFIRRWQRSRFETLLGLLTLSHNRLVDVRTTVA